VSGLSKRAHEVFSDESVMKLMKIVQKAERCCFYFVADLVVQRNISITSLGLGCPTWLGIRMLGASPSTQVA